MTKAKAFVLKDGNVIPESALAKYAIKGETSKQLPPDAFLGEYGVDTIVEPLYNIEALAKLLEENTYHYRAVKTVSRDALGNGFELLPRRGVETPDEAAKTTITRRLEEMDITENLTETLIRAGEDYKSTGNGYLEFLSDSEGKFTGFTHIPSHTVRRHADGKRYQQQRGARKAWFKEIGYQMDVHFLTGQVFPLGKLKPEERANEIIHFSNYTPRSDYYGLPEVLPALAALLADRQRAEYNLNFFENHAMPAYAVTITGTDLDEDAVAQIKGFFNKDLKENRQSTLVLAASKDPNDPSSEPIEFKFEALTPQTQEASFTLFRKDNKDEILAAHGVPSYRLGITETGSLGGNTAKESTEIYKDSIVRPFQKMFEDVINKYVLWNSMEATDWELKFNEIDNDDEKHDMEIAHKLFAMGAITPNELRVKFKLEPIENPALDKFYINNVPAELAGQEQESALTLKAMKNKYDDLMDILDSGVIYDQD